MPHTSAVLESFGEHLRERRNLQRLSQEYAAQLCGLHRTYYSALERGERNPTLVVLSRISAGYQVSLSELLDGVG